MVIECDLCPSCSVRTNRRTACVLLRVLPFLLQYVCFLDPFSLSSLLFSLTLLRLSSHLHLIPNSSTLALRAAAYRTRGRSSLVRTRTRHNRPSLARSPGNHTHTVQRWAWLRRRSPTSSGCRRPPVLSPSPWQGKHPGVDVQASHPHPKKATS